MELSRQQLYALGEPLGNDVTRFEGGRMIYGKGSRSTSSSTSATNNIDNRAVADNGSLAVTGSTGNVISFTDNGAVNKALEFAGDAGNHLISAEQANYGKLLDVGLSVLTQGQKNLSATTDTLSAAYQDAKGGAAQDRYIALAGIAGAVAVAYAFSRKN